MTAPPAPSGSTSGHTWRSWSGLETARPRRVVRPADTAAVVAEVERARAEGTTVKMVGSGHSFTGVAVAEHTLLEPQALTGILAVDRTAMTVTVAAGTRLHELDLGLEALGLSLHNLGDIDAQTVAGAISTGTHGTGGSVAGLAAQVVGLELVTGTGEVLRADADQHPEVFAVARVGLGALGILTSVTLAVEPLFVLRSEEQPTTWDAALASYDEVVAAHDHVDLYWFPHTERVLVKRHDRAGTDLSAARPLPRLRAWLDDELLANTLFGLETAAASRVPVVVPRMNRLNARLLGARSYSDVAHRVLTSRRAVRFREMEYAVPRAAGPTALREARAALDASGLRVGFPVEVRTAPADDVALSTASDRDSLYLAFHTHHATDHTAYFALMEAVVRAHDGRPHWGKLHTRSADDLAALYPRMGEFLAVRDRLDPDRVFANAYLRRVLGP